MLATRLRPAFVSCHLSPCDGGPLSVRSRESAGRVVSEPYAYCWGTHFICFFSLVNSLVDDEISTWKVRPHEINPFLFETLLCACRYCRMDAHNILRPETLESLYYLYWVTGEEGYRDSAWAIFQAFERHCRVDRGGYAGLEDVTDVRLLCTFDETASIMNTVLLPRIVPFSHPFGGSASSHLS